MENEKLRLSYSKTNCFMRCRQEYFWHYTEGLSPKAKSWPLKLGDITHQLLHGHDKNELDLEFIQDLNKVMGLATESYPEEEEDTLLELAMQASRLCTGYLHEHKDAELTMIPGETFLEKDMGDFTLVGIPDGWARPADGKLFRLERKTGAKIDHHYLSGLKGGLQAAIYDYLTEQLFQETLHGTIYDMLIKTKEPKFPRAFAKCDRVSIALMLRTLDGVYRDIMAGDYYPSTACFRYNSECPYRVLCAFDSPGNRKAHFTRREEVNKPQPIEDGESNDQGD